METCYNRHDRCHILASRLLPAGSMYETLTKEQLALVTPAEPLQGMSFTNSCHYWVSGTRMQVYLLDFHIETAYGESIRVSMGEEAHDSGCCTFYDADSKISKCGNVDYALYEAKSKNKSDGKLIAKATINDVPVLVIMKNTENVRRAKKDFEKVLEWLSTYREGYPAISQLAPLDGPKDVINQTLSLEEAQKDPNFGKFMLKNEPEGFSLHSITRSKYGEVNSLSGIWEDGNNRLDWDVSEVQPTHYERMVSVDSELYEKLSAYSNSPSHMVPEELRECLFHPIYYIEELTLDMVRDRAEISSEAQKMLFSVKFGDVVVLINSRGVTPEWIYQQLVQIRDNLE